MVARGTLTAIRPAFSRDQVCLCRLFRFELAHIGWWGACAPRAVLSTLVRASLWSPRRRHPMSPLDHVFSLPPLSLPRALCPCCATSRRRCTCRRFWRTTQRPCGETSSLTPRGGCLSRAPRNGCLRMSVACSSRSRRNWGPCQLRKQLASWREWRRRSATLLRRGASKKIVGARMLLRKEGSAPTAPTAND